MALWHSWQSICFRRLRTRVRIRSTRWFLHNFGLDWQQPINKKMFPMRGFLFFQLFNRRWNLSEPTNHWMTEAENLLELLFIQDRGRGKSWEGICLQLSACYSDRSFGLFTFLNKIRDKFSVANYLAQKSVWSNDNEHNNSHFYFFQNSFLKIFRRQQNVKAGAPTHAHTRHWN